jgi:tetratricopeptide (TPR) repeat protein
MKKWPQAIDELLMAREIDEWYPGVEEGLKVTLHKAFSDLKKWVSDEPMEPLSHYYLSYAHQYKGDVKKAMKEIEKAIELKRSKGEFYKAKAFFCINSDPFQNKREDIMAVYKKHKDAIAAYKECITMDPSNWACYKSLSDSYLTIAELKEALDAIIKAVNISPNIISVQSYLGVAYRKNGENEKALVAFQKAVSLGAKNPIVYSNLAATYIDLGKYDMAWRYARMAERMGFQGVSVIIKRLKQVSKEPE